MKGRGRVEKSRNGDSERKKSVEKEAEERKKEEHVSTCNAVLTWLND